MIKLKTEVEHKSYDFRFDTTLIQHYIEKIDDGREY